jgi:hypothetical protein
MNIKQKCMENVTCVFVSSIRIFCFYNSKSWERHHTGWIQLTLQTIFNVNKHLCVHLPVIIERAINRLGVWETDVEVISLKSQS